MLLDSQSLARELLSAWTAGRPVPEAPSARDAAFDLAAAYAVGAEVVRMRVAGGRRVVGRKIGYANKAMWRALRLNTLVWAPMYDDTVRYATRASAVVPLRAHVLPKIEPEIMFKLKRPLMPSDAENALEAVEWLALGFEVIDVAIPGKYQPRDFVAALGFHVALIVGEPCHVSPENVARLAAQLAEFTVKLVKDDEVIAEGGGSNVLRSPALALGELGVAVHEQPGAPPLEAGEIISTGSLADAQPIAPGETWRATAEGLPVADVTATFTRVN